MSKLEDGAPKSAGKRAATRTRAKKSPRARSDDNTASSTQSPQRHAGSATAADMLAPTPMISVPIAVRWDDLDAFNHVNNATFLVYAQEARLAWLATIDGAWFDATMMPVVAAVQTSFRRQLPWPNAIVVDLTASRIGTSSLTIHHRIRDASDSACIYADGDVVMVWINPTDGRPVALPVAIRSSCQFSAEASAGSTSK